MELIGTDTHLGAVFNLGDSISVELRWAIGLSRTANVGGEQKVERRSDDGRYGERGVRTALHIARVATLIGMPMGSYLLGSRTGAQDSTLPLEGLDAVASRRLQL